MTCTRGSPISASGRTLYGASVADLSPPGNFDTFARDFFTAARGSVPTGAQNSFLGYYFAVTGNLIHGAGVVIANDLTPGTFQIPYLGNWNLVKRPGTLIYNGITYAEWSVNIIGGAGTFDTTDTTDTIGADNLFLQPDAYFYYQIETIRVPTRLR